MGTFQHKPESGSIFPNDYKERDAQPDWTGTALIDGTEYRLAGWNNTGGSKDYISIKFEKKADFEARRTGQTGGQAARSPMMQAAIDRAKARQAEMASKGGQRTMADSYDDAQDDDIPF